MALSELLEILDRNIPEILALCRIILALCAADALLLALIYFALIRRRK